MKIGIYMTMMALVATGCAKEVNPVSKLQGLWCNNLYHCIFFNGNNCLIDKAETNQFSCSESDITVDVEENRRVAYNYKLLSNSLKIREKDEAEYRDFFRVNEFEEIGIDKLYYSQASDFSSFSCLIEKDRFKLEIQFDPTIKSGKYIGLINSEFKDLISALVNQMDTKISHNLDGAIVSDIQEWGLIIQTESEAEIKLYHNYKGINKNHMYFATMMSYFPLFHNLEAGNFDDELLGVKQYREEEFKRNLKEVGQ